MKIITEEMRFRKRLCEFALKYSNEILNAPVELPLVNLVFQPSGLQSSIKAI